MVTLVIMVVEKGILDNPINGFVPGLEESWAKLLICKLELAYYYYSRKDRRVGKIRVNWEAPKLKVDEETQPTWSIISILHLMGLAQLHSPYVGC